MTSRFNYPWGCSDRDIDPPLRCNCCDEVIQGETWTDSNQNPYCAECVALLTTKTWTSYASEN